MISCGAAHRCAGKGSKSGGGGFEFGRARITSLSLSTPPHTRRPREAVCTAAQQPTTLREASYADQPPRGAPAMGAPAAPSARTSGDASSGWDATALPPCALGDGWDGSDCNAGGLERSGSKVRRVGRDGRKETRAEFRARRAAPKPTLVGFCRPRTPARLTPINTPHTHTHCSAPCPPPPPAAPPPNARAARARRAA